MAGHLLIALSVLLAPGWSYAYNDHPMVAAVLQVRKTATRETVVWIARLPPPPLPVAFDPTAPFAVSAQFEINGGILPMNLSGERLWRLNRAGTAYKFYSPELTVKAAIVRQNGLVRVRTRRAPINMSAPQGGPVKVVLLMDQDAYCSECTVAKVNEPGRYLAMNCPAPTVCLNPEPGPCRNLGGFPACGGDCPTDSFCFSTFNGCECRPESEACGVTGNVCGGLCTDPFMHCSDLPSPPCGCRVG
jgi:hypothetical protein